MSKTDAFGRRLAVLCSLFALAASMPAYAASDAEQDDRHAVDGMGGSPGPAPSPAPDPAAPPGPPQTVVVTGQQPPPPPPPSAPDPDPPQTGGQPPAREPVSGPGESGGAGDPGKKEKQETVGDNNSSTGCGSSSKPWSYRLARR